MRRRWTTRDRAEGAIRSPWRVGRTLLRAVTRWRRQACTASADLDPGRVLSHGTGALLRGAVGIEQRNSLPKHLETEGAQVRGGAAAERHWSVRGPVATGHAGHGAVE